MMELKAFSASTKSTASVSSCWNKSYIAWMAASALASWPAYTCKDPAACWTAFFAISMITFPAIRRITPQHQLVEFRDFYSEELNDLQ